MNEVFEIAARDGSSRVVGRYVPSAKNGMVKGFYQPFGFRSIEESGGETLYALDTRDYVRREVHIRKVADSETAGEDAHP